MELPCCLTRGKLLGIASMLGIAVITLHAISTGFPVNIAEAIFTECADGIDNDHDGMIDYPQDVQCLSLQDESEGPTGQGLFLSLSDGKETVTPSGSLTYIIGLRTERENPENIDVHFQMPHQTNLIGTSGDATRNDELISWKNVTLYPGNLRKLTVTVEVKPGAQEGLLLVAEAYGEGEKTTDTTRVTHDHNIDIQSAPRLDISVTDGKKYAQPGEVLEYLIAVTNPSSQMRDFDLRFQIPTDTEVVAIDGKYASNRQAITWNAQTIEPRGAREYRVALRIKEDVPEFYMVRTHASIGVSVASDTTTIHTGALPDAIIATTTDNLDQVAPGSLVTYDIGLQNETNQLATELDLQNALPTYLEFVDASEGGYWTGTNVRWKGLTVAPNGTRSLRVTGRVRSDAPIGTRLKSTIAVNGAQSVDYTTVDTNVRGIGVSGQDDVLISKTSDRTEVQPGEQVTYTVTLRNITGRTLTAVKVEDRMDSPYMQILSGGQGGTMSANSIAWVIPSLEPEQVWSVQYTAQVDRRAPNGISVPNIVTVSGGGMDTVSLEQRIQTSDIAIISNLPPTGAAFDAIFLGLSGVAGAAQTMMQRRKQIKLA